MQDLTELSDMGQFSGDKTGAISGLKRPQLKLIRASAPSDGCRRHAPFAPQP
jgi:hypothetical protein